MKLFDGCGREIERERLRPAIGFRPQLVKADEPETLTPGALSRSDRSDWISDGHRQSGRWIPRAEDQP